MIALFIAWSVLALAEVVRAILETRPSSGQATSNDDAGEHAPQAIALSVF